MGEDNVPLAGTSPLPAVACSSAVCESFGRDVKTREADRGSWSASEEGFGSSGIGGGGEGGMLEVLRSQGSNEKIKWDYALARP